MIALFLLFPSATTLSFRLFKTWFFSVVLCFVLFFFLRGFETSNFGAHWVETAFTVVLASYVIVRVFPILSYYLEIEAYTHPFEDEGDRPVSIFLILFGLVLDIASYPILWIIWVVWSAPPSSFT